MRIAGIEIFEHPGIGDLSLDFRDATGKAPRTLIIAGENGCGKTAILELLFVALAPTAITNRHIEESIGYSRVYCEVDPDFDISNIMRDPFTGERVAPTGEAWKDFEGLLIEVGHPRAEPRDLSNIYNLYSDVKNSRPQAKMFRAEEALGSPYRCFYADADVTFKVQGITSITAEANPAAPESNDDLRPRIRSSTQTSREIAQLLVDLETADNADVARWVHANPGKGPPNEILKQRVRRFTDAFARIFTHKAYIGYETKSGLHVPMFKQGSLNTPLAKLSTGEKQIIFRGAFLLREAENLRGAVVLVDEPELSLHPNWQSRILKYYDDIVGPEADKTSQIIVATHSPFVVHGSPSAKHIILRRDQATGQIQADASPSYPGVTAADSAIAAFDLTDFVSSASAKSAAIVVEGSTDKSIMELAWGKLYPTRHMPFAIIPAGGAKALTALLRDSTGKSGPLIEALAAANTRKVVGVWDFDHAGIPQWQGAVKDNEAEESETDLQKGVWRKRRGEQVWTVLLPVPLFRMEYAALEDDMHLQSRLTIELLFPDFHVEPLLSRKRVLGAPGITLLKATTEKQKRDVASAAAGFSPQAFENFKPLFDLFERLLA